MSVALYMDVHVERAITEQLRSREVDVVTAKDDGRAEDAGELLLERSTELQRVLFTQDIGFKSMAEDWERSGREFAGLVFGHQLGGTIGQFVEDLELISKASEPEERVDRIEHIPF